MPCSVYPYLCASILKSSVRVSRVPLFWPPGDRLLYVQNKIGSRILINRRYKALIYADGCALLRAQVQQQHPNAPHSMAPSKKKAAKTLPRMDGTASASPAAASTPSSQASSTRGASKPQPVQQTVSSRPKRHAEKRFYDDMEDERPQHLSTRGPKKKKGG